MAEFSIREVEGMRQVRVDLRDETIRIAHGALSNFAGKIRFKPRLPGAGDLFRSMFTQESRIRPYLSGTGRIHLQPSLSGYHVLEVQNDERWILEPGAYWASEASVRLGLRRDSLWASLWAGDGLLAWKTTLSGAGRAAINAPGPVEVVDVEDGELRAQGRLVLGRTDGLRFRSYKAAPFPRSLISGQSRLRVFEGTGKVLVCWTPYWNEHLYVRMTGESIAGSLFE
ncbi:MAG: AIM24 family protein [Paracoccaceae bacterium]